MAYGAESTLERRGRIFEIARMNYRTLVEHCDLLVAEGYWEQAGSILRQSIYDVLDLYLQSVLIRMAVYGKASNESERQFILTLPDSRQYEIMADREIDREIQLQAERFIQSPPIILQLCGLRDREHHSDMTASYFDAFLNILVAMSWMSDARESYIIRFVKEFYQSVEAFLLMEDRQKRLNERYLFRKVSADPEMPEEWKSMSHRDEPEDRPISTGNVAIEEEQEIREEELPTIEEEEAEAQRKIQQAAEATQSQDALEKLLAELQELIGLREVKSEIQSLINLIKIRKLRAERGLPAMEMSYHMVFTGSPGTGKTTVARLVARIYKELGLLSKGTLVETDRSGLVAGYVGQTALKVKEVVEKAIGGVLFIDEAYSLAGAGAAGNDFGAEAIDTLVKLMEDHRDDLVVIVAGYTEEMKQFLASNTGLVSRFNKFIEFPDYTEEELVQIFVSMADKMAMTLTEEVTEKLQACLTGMTAGEKQIFGNARGVRNLFEKAVVYQANRLVEQAEPTVEELSEIRWSDLEQSLQ